MIYFNRPRQVQKEGKASLDASNVQNDASNCLYSCMLEILICYDVILLEVNIVSETNWTKRESHGALSPTTARWNDRRDAFIEIQLVNDYSVSSKIGKETYCIS